ncbi:MAG: hypothetical protein AAGN46_11985 [Acidobacteriota bacterium]
MISSLRASLRHLSLDPLPDEDGATARGVDLSAERRSSWMLAVALVATTMPLWLVRWLPMVDLPQHASQVATWHAWVDGTFAWTALWEVNFRTPYLLSRSLAFLLSHAVDLLDAYRILVSLAIVALPLAALLLLRTIGGAPSWALAVVPLGYGYAFDWGFVAYSLAVPLGLLHLALAWRQARCFTWSRAVGLWIATQALFFAHVFVFGWAGLTAAAVLGLRARGWRALSRAWAPLLAALPLPLWWILTTAETDREVLGGPVFGGGWLRLPQAFSLQVGRELPTMTSLAVGLALFTLPLLLGGRPSRDLVRWAPFIITLILFLATPESAFGTGFIYPRFAVFLLPAWLMTLVPTRQPRLHQGWLLGLVLVLAVDVGWRLRGFDREVGDFDRVVEAVAPETRILYLPVDPGSAWSDNAVYLHFGQWLQVERGALVDFSFGEFFPNLFRYRQGADPPLPNNVEWMPWAFDYRRHGGMLYDYFLVRAPRDPTGLLFSDVLTEIRPVRQVDGGWWLYARRGGRGDPAAGADDG